MRLKRGRHQITIGVRLVHHCSNEIFINLDRTTSKGPFENIMRIS